MPLADALKSMKRANSGLTWIRQAHVQDFLARLAATEHVTHEQIDELPSSPTREHVRGLLVVHGALPQRDSYLATFNDWLGDLPARLSNSEHRNVLDRYIRWDHLRKMHANAPVTRGMFLRSKQTLTVAVDFLNWITDEGLDLAGLAQDDIDVWASGGPTTRLLAERFLNWARKNRLVETDLKMPRHKRGTAPRLGILEQQSASERLLDPSSMDPRDRAAGVLILVFGQQLEHLVRLKWEDVIVRQDAVVIEFGGEPMTIPEPFDEVWRTLYANPTNNQTAAHPSGDLVFPGYRPGKPLNPGYLGDRIKVMLQARAARLGALNELTKLAPMVIVAKALGYSATTLENHARDAGATYARYLGVVKSLAKDATLGIRVHDL
ncbi:Fis family transcriptional regulator [Microbacterium foliorum]|uniref:Fis family transcriptional regulator n=1 Tax=Microbacterium foliorum TaxID=104336 RepID=UPI0021597265|nr:Fis family transcriptional regulator [Microbacterium foliorum]